MKKRKEIWIGGGKRSERWSVSEGIGGMGGTEWGEWFGSGGRGGER